MEKACEEIVDFLAGGTTPNGVVAFAPSEATKTRVGDLIARHKNEGLDEGEIAELESFMQLEHLMRLVKARAV